jgi:predicted adenine nucleotide alpha hydrolase (AANH) superfamily ATPase
MKPFQGITMPECTVQLWYNKQRIKNSGDVSLYLQIIVGCEHSEVKLKNLQWPANKIDWKKKTLLPRSKEDQEYVTYTAIAERERAKYWAVVMNFLKQDTYSTLSDIFREVNLYKSGHKFCDFMEQAIKARQKTLVKKDMIKQSTARVHRTTLKYFREFTGNYDVEITSFFM